MRANAVVATGSAGVLAMLAACATVPSTYEEFAASGGFSMYPIPSAQTMAEIARSIEAIADGEAAASPDLAQESAAEPSTDELVGPEFYLTASGAPAISEEQLSEYAYRYAAEQTLERGYAFFIVTSASVGTGVDNMRAVGDQIVTDPARYVNLTLTMLPADAELPDGVVDAAAALASQGAGAQERN